MEDWGLGDLVYRTSVLLLYPTLVLLILAFLRMMWNLGELVQDCWALRGYHHAKTARQLRDIRLDERQSVVPSLTAIIENHGQPPQLRRFVRLLLDELARGPCQTLAARIQHLVGQTEASLARDVNRVRVFVRLGPCLGLAGTLIPLGPGLMALNEGDLASLSSQLVMAFSTTVVGLLIGGVSYVIVLARAHTADLLIGDIELVGDIVATLLNLHSADASSGRAQATEAAEAAA
jgi:biopolymer transport protein ExbB/TolQ